MHKSAGVKVRERLKKAARPARNIIRPRALQPDDVGQARSQRPFLHQEGTPGVGTAVGHNALRNEPHNRGVGESGEDPGFVLDALVLLAAVAGSHLDRNIGTALQVYRPKDFGSRPAAQPFPKLPTPGNSAV